MNHHDRWRNRKRLYKLDYRKYLRKYLPRGLRYLAYPSLALALLIEVDVSLPSTVGETYVPTRVLKVPETSQGGEALLYAFSPVEQPSDLVVHARQVSGEKKWHLRKFNIPDYLAKRIESDDSLVTRTTAILENTVSVKILREEQVVARDMDWFVYILEILLFLSPGYLLIWSLPLKDDVEGRLTMFFAGVELFALGYWLSLAEHLIV